MLAGLEHVHLQIEMLFRDLKPGNIVFDSHRNAKITDFGSANSVHMYCRHMFDALRCASILTALLLDLLM